MSGIPSPDEFVEWATAATAETTDPGATLSEDGWAVGDAPASSHYNYVLNASTGFSWWPADRLKSTVAYGNIEYDLTTSYGALDPWGTDASDYFVQYFSEVNRWYVLRRNTSGGSIDIFDSDDGENWGASLNVADGITVANGELTRPVVAHGRFMFGAGDSFFISTDHSVQNVQVYDGTAYQTITDVFELVYDPLGNYLYAVGGDSSNDGRIERMLLTDENMNDPTRPPAFDGWTSVETDATYEFRTIAVSPTGYFLAGTTSETASYYSSDGDTWTSFDWTPMDAPTRIKWSPVLDAFWVVDDSGNLYTVPDSSQTDSDTGLDASSIIEGDDFVWVRDGFTEELYALFGNSTTAATLGSHMDLGAMHIGIDVGAEFGEYTAGQGKLMWPASTGTITARQALTYYGPKNQ